MEKVWVAEQKAEQEQKKLVELQKQLQEERQIQELRQLQVQHGQNIRNVDSSLDWMYEGPSASSIKQQQSEEFLLGKIYKPQENNTFDLSVPGKCPHRTCSHFLHSLLYFFSCIVQLSSKKSDKWMEKVSHKNDIFARMHEDPMVAIKQAEKQVRVDIA